MEKLFIYGSLQPGGPNNHIMEKIGGDWAPATVKGHLKEAGWGADIGFPGIMIDESGDEVKGYIFSSDNLGSHWDGLDDFEGDGYRRILVPATLEDGKQVEVYIYALKDTAQA